MFRLLLKMLEGTVSEAVLDTEDFVVQEDFLNGLILVTNHSTVCSQSSSENNMSYKGQIYRPYQGKNRAGKKSAIKIAYCLCLFS